MEQSRYLPEGIIHHILRFLNAKDQIRVCSLSKDWLHAWQTCPALKFSDWCLRCPIHRALRTGAKECDNYCSQCRLRFQDHVSKTLLNYKGEHIQALTLDIYHSDDQDSAAALDKLLEIALKKGVKQLKLLINRYRYIKVAVRYYYVVPVSIFGDQSLTDLMIESCRFPPSNQLFNGGKFLMFNNIKSLSLAYVYIEDEMFRLLLSACPLIQNLDIKLCEGLTSIKLVNLPRLKKINMCHEVRKNLIFAVDAPSLETLNIRYIRRTSCLLQLPASKNLRELMLARAYITTTFFDDWRSKFPRLEVLELESCYGFEKINLRSHSLKLISFRSLSEESLVEFEIDVPNIIEMKIIVSAETLQKVSFKGALPRQCVSRLCIHDCRWSSIDVSWFMKLNELLSSLNPSKISLCVCCQRPLSERACFGGITTSAAHPSAHPVDIEDLDLREFQKNLECHLNFLDGLFWACRPKNFVLHWGGYFAYLPVKFFFDKKFKTDQRNGVFSNLTHTLSFWKQYLKKTEFHAYDMTGKKFCLQDYLHWLKASKIILHLDWSASSNLWNAKTAEPLTPKSSSAKNSVTEGLAPQGSQLDAIQCDAKMTELLNPDGEDFLISNDEMYDSFESMGLQENLLRGIYAYGVERPSPVQQRGLVPFCKGLDVIQQARSGAGKTTTLCLGILQQLDYNVVDCQALVLVPNLELAGKTEKVMRSLGNYLGVKVHACEGAASVREDQCIFSHGVHVVVGTPDCVFDMLSSQSLSPEHVKMVVLNQADEMISGGFRNEIYDIFQLLAPKIQVGVFLATMPPEALGITRKLMNKPVRVLVKRDEFTAEGMKKLHANAEEEEAKIEALSDLSETDEAAISWLDKRCRLWKPKNITKR